MTQSIPVIDHDQKDTVSPRHRHCSFWASGCTALGIPEPGYQIYCCPECLEKMEQACLAEYHRRGVRVEADAPDPDQ